MSLSTHWSYVFCETQWRHSVKTRLYNTPSPILHSVKSSDVTRWKQGYIRTLPHTSLYYPARWKQRRSRSLSFTELQIVNLPLRIPLHKYFFYPRYFQDIIHREHKHDTLSHIDSMLPTVFDAGPWTHGVCCVGRATHTVNCIIPVPTDNAQCYLQELSANKVRIIHIRRAITLSTLVTKNSVVNKII